MSEPVAPSWDIAECISCKFQVEGYCRRFPPQIIEEGAGMFAGDSATYPKVCQTVYNDDDTEHKFWMEACAEYVLDNSEFESKPSCQHHPV
jgi:hypothetical protein